MTEPIVLARAFHIAATALAAGTVCFMVLVAEPAFGTALQGGRPRHSAPPCSFPALQLMIWIALAAAVLSGVTWLALLAADIYGAPVVAVCLHGGLWPVLTGTRFGAVWTARLAVALLLALSLVWPATRYLQLALAGVLLAGLAFIGHAGATPGTVGNLHLTSDIVHLIAAGAWLGGLPALAMLLLATQRVQGTAARAAERFSLLGIVCVGALAASGLVNSWNLLGAPSDLIDSGYGRLLLLKLGLFAAMLGIATVNRFHLTPRLKAAGARRALARNSLAETGLGLGVLLMVGALGTMPPTAHKVLPPVDIPEDAAFVHIHSEEVMADVTIDPGRARPSQCQYSRIARGLLGIPGKRSPSGARSTGAGPAAGQPHGRTANRRDLAGERHKNWAAWKLDSADYYWPKT